MSADSRSAAALVASLASALRHDDLDPTETREWLDSLASVIERDGPERASFLLDALQQAAGASGLTAGAAGRVITPYINSLPAATRPATPGDRELEDRLLAVLRWNAMAIVVRANRVSDGIGGHIATFQSVGQLFEMGFNHFWRGPVEREDGTRDGGDLVYFQGHASPGLYARAHLEGRITTAQLDRFRMEVGGGGLSSYPHPYLMPDFWQFATVSMGLGPLTAIYQARFMKYLHNRGLRDTAGRHVWAFLGDGEMDEPESLGAITVASREKLDNLVFVINCNLQRLDGPVRGNGKIVQELEGIFHGAGWRVIKLLWGSAWDPLFARDAERGGHLVRRLTDMVDGEMQVYGARDGAYMRERLFNTPELRALIENLDDDQLKGLHRGGHDPATVHAAYRAAVDQGDGQPVVILAQTIKGYGLGSGGEGLNTAHQEKKPKADARQYLRDHLGLHDLVPDAALEDDAVPLIELPDDDPAVRYLRARREALDGPLPRRYPTSSLSLPVPALDTFSVLTKGSGAREQSTTTAFVRFLNLLTRDKALKAHLVPILADEARTFGMEGMFRQIGIYAPEGQKYEPVDAEQLMFYKEAKDGQILQEGITEAGGLASWTCAGTSYANHDLPMIPFFIFYSMFGFQRVGDFIWAAADQGARGFLLGATSGRTTLNGEGLQHEDGHSHLIAATVPNCLAYDPTYAYEVAVIMRDGLERMVDRQENVFYYLTLLNENYPQLAMPDGVEDGILRGMYPLRTSAKRGKKKRVQLLGCGSILREVEAAAALLEDEHGVAADVWSVTSFTELRRDGLAIDRHNLRHPGETPRTAYVADQLAGTSGPVIASTDHMASFADQIRSWVPRRYVTLGTDGFGRSDSREALRRFFEVDRHHVVVAALKALADEGVVDADVVRDAMVRYDIDPATPDPTTV
ncbi:MAG: pyruvate dehydrogenase (acetyl-transferring), homodimeric type [Acidobacteriota bacterium]